METRKKSGSNSVRRNKSAESKLKLDCSTTQQSTILEEQLGEHPAEEKPPSPIATKINYQDELVFFFFSSMLDAIVDEWITIPDEPVCQCPKKTPRVDPVTVCFDSKDNVTLMPLIGSSILSDFDLTEGTSTRRRRSSSKRTSLHNCPTGKESPKVINADRCSRISLRRTSKDSAFAHLEKSGGSSFKDKTIAEDESRSRSSTDWILKVPDENAVIKFKNGNKYEGMVSKKVMHGSGKFIWADGAVYEGDFVNGFATGKGTLIYPDLTAYDGEFCKNRLQGHGTLNISGTSMIYKGEWMSGKKHGKGWMLYEKGNEYDGEWYEDKRHGFGTRTYPDGTVYQGCWLEGKRHGSGSIAWPNKDFYKGEWRNGTIDGYGDYTWKTFLNKTFTFPVRIIYKGSWQNGQKHGVGHLFFGSPGGAQLAGIWKNDLKHGAGVALCEDGRIVQRNPLFLHDKPVRVNCCSRTPEAIAEDPSTSTEESKTTTKKLESQDTLVSSLERLQRRKSSYKLIAEDSSSTSSRSQSQLEAENVQKNQLLCPLQATSFEETESNYPIPIRIYSPPHNTDFSYFIQLALDKYIEQLYKCECFRKENLIQTLAFGWNRDCSETISPTTRYAKWNLSQIFNIKSLQEGEDSSQKNSTETSFSEYHSRLCDYRAIQRSIEEVSIRNSMIYYMPKINQLYNKYAKIAASEPICLDVIMIRMFLWQMLRDIKLFTVTGLSLVDFDRFLYNSRCISFETKHDPFERVYLWQFLHVLIGLAWLSHSENVVKLECKRFGILSTVFSSFWETVIEQHVEITSGCSLFAYRDLVPMGCVYQLYKQIGEPHTARKFLNMSCVKKGTEPPCYLRAFDDEIVAAIPVGSNVVATSGNLIYLPDEEPDIGEVYEPETELSREDPFRFHLYALRSLGCKKTVKCLIAVCPQIAEDGVIVNMNSELSFIEFYDALLMCSFMIIEAKKKREEEMRRLLEEKLRMEELLRAADNLSKTTLESQRSLKGRRRSSKTKT